jgi:hypothetical protein
MRDPKSGCWRHTQPYHHSYRHQFDHLGLGHLSDQICFMPDFSLLGSNGLDPALAVSQVSQVLLAKAGIPVLCLDANLHDIQSTVRALDQAFGLASPWLVIDPDIRGILRHSRVVSWPSWLILQQIEHDGSDLLSRQHRVSFLSGVPRYHRLALWQAVQDLVTPDDVVVINRFAADMWNSRAVPVGLWSECQHWLELLPWSNQQRFIDNNQDQSSALKCGTLDHAAYRACVNITGETVSQSGPMLLSEMTWKAYRAGCLTVNFGQMGVASYLKNLGIQTPADLDPDLPVPEKILCIREIFCRDDIWDLWHDNIDMVQHNRELVLSADFARSLALSTTDLIESLLNTV